MSRRTFSKKNYHAKRRRKTSPLRYDKAQAGGGPLPAREVTKWLDDIAGFLHAQGGESRVREIVAALDLTRGARKEIHHVLTSLCHRKILQQTGDKTYRLNQTMFTEGEIAVHPRGFAFVTPDARQGEVTAGKDIFIPPRDLGTSLHGDTVLVMVTGARRDRYEGRVVKVLHRAVKNIVGIFRDGPSGGLVIPEDERFPFKILIEKDKTGGAASGEAVSVSIGDYGGTESYIFGRVIDVLGDPESLQVQMEMVIRKHDLPRQFSDAALAEARAFPAEVTVSKDRLDLRDVLHVTIDGETARDFDDAVSVTKTRTGYQLLVSIADVSHYVKPGSALDREAYERGTSVYFPTGVLPMLPERLSNDLCSLNPRVDRYAFTAMLDFDQEGRRKKMRFQRSVIRSSHRLTYTLVRQILVDQDAELRRNHEELLTPLKWMAELGTRLEERRMARGSLAFEIPEPAIEIGPHDTIETISARERNLAHKIIEEFMLAANEAVAETFAQRHYPALYRIHESPDHAKVAEFAEFMQALGYHSSRTEWSSKWFNKMLDLTRGTTREYLVSNLILRVMQQARYSPENCGHFGLAAPYYTHFTSPIRRYPDLTVHRALATLLSGDGKDRKKGEKKGESLVEDGEFLSKRERVAVDAEREMVERLKVRFMADKIGETFAGIISGVSSFGLFVELVDSMISGMVSLADMVDDYYEVNEKRHSLTGRRGGKVYQIGDQVTVRLISVDKARQRINFVLEGNEPEDG